MDRRAGRLRLCGDDMYDVREMGKMSPNVAIRDQGDHAAPVFLRRE